ncbi:hypothetical protein [Planococcus lenghuensis]|uniref:hypothetical protein n=1 Tax=Planococcus lenghuensis TaxID=2213202 RepID=UPI001E323BBD|nr:hypothetical protein [Planococcus lenghuensis]
MTKSVKEVSPEKAEQALFSASHSLVTEGFEVSGEDRNLVRLLLTGEWTERQFQEAVKNRYNV